MSITIKLNDSPNLPKCNFLCDDPLHEKLNQYELTQFLNQHSTTLLIGKPKSGKTSLMYSFMKSPKILRKCFHTIFLFQPSASRLSMKDKIFDSIPEDQKFEELDFNSLYDVVERVKNEDKKYNNCIIIDDLTAYLKNNDVQKLFKDLIFNRRHYRTSIYFLCQTWFSIPKEIRRLFNNIFVFRTSKNELTSIFEEVVEQKKDLVGDIARVVYDQPYQYLFINTESQRLFKNFDELIINTI